MTAKLLDHLLIFKWCIGMSCNKFYSSYETHFGRYSFPGDFPSLGYLGKKILWMDFDIQKTCTFINRLLKMYVFINKIICNCEIQGKFATLQKCANGFSEAYQLYQSSHPLSLCNCPLYCSPRKIKSCQELQLEMYMLKKFSKLLPLIFLFYWQMQNT